MEPTTTLTSVQLIKIVGMAIFGAIVHALIAHRKGHTKGLVDVLMLTFISAFGGVIGGILIVNFYPSNEMYLLAGSGVGGYLGVEGLTWGVNYLKNKFTK